MTKIKICGITTEEQVRAAVEAGADFIGLVFAESRRRVGPNEARNIAKAARKRGNGVQTVGVFVKETADNIMATAEKVGLDWLQLSGDEPASFGRRLDRPVIQVVHVGGESSVTLSRRLDRMDKVFRGHQHLFLLDTHAKHRYGGTGKAFDWEAAKVVAERFPLVLAGGLTPDNVTDALDALHPWGVDVSTGVETDGSKDVDKIREFITKVREYDA